MGYRIISGTWENLEKTAAVLTISEDNGEPYYYTCAKDGYAPINQLLWDMLSQDSTMVQDSVLLKVMKGEMDVPEGFTLINGQLINDEAEKIKVRNLINARLEELYTGRALTMAEKDPVYAANRQRQIDWLLSLENSQGFPYEINWAAQEE